MCILCNSCVGSLAGMGEQHVTLNVQSMVCTLAGTGQHGFNGYVTGTVANMTPGVHTFEIDYFQVRHCIFSTIKATMGLERRAIGDRPQSSTIMLAPVHS